ncbi:MAG: putative Ig domain-containing protein [Synergistaceae bacterium]|nr:putative Ig domain-containing protein [Synergistaceae bacterium]
MYYTATGENITWSMSGTLPAGLTFSWSGNAAIISGTPSAGSAGSYPVTVTATNLGGSSSATVAITVAALLRMYHLMFHRTFSRKLHPM